MKNKKKWIVRGIMTWIIIDKVILFKACQEMEKELVQKHDAYMKQMQMSTNLLRLNTAMIKRMHPSQRQQFIDDLNFAIITKDL